MGTQEPFRYSMKHFWDVVVFFRWVGVGLGVVTAARVESAEQAARQEHKHMYRSGFVARLNEPPARPAMACPLLDLVDRNWLTGPD